MKLKIVVMGSASGKFAKSLKAAYELGCAIAGMDCVFVNIRSSDIVIIIGGHSGTFG